MPHRRNPEPVDHDAIAGILLDTIGPMNADELGMLLKFTLLTISATGHATWPDMQRNTALARRHVRANQTPVAVES
ncbi:MAG: hypothetical protein QOH55_2205 [Microbacteriaceae bacterium]|jgi:hypothetical protein|nr:hypothetical protein [Microbacteriaceae bacterium]